MTRGAGPLIAIALAACATVAQAQELGRLFFTPEQRAQLDERRKAHVPDKPAAVLVESPSTRLDGYVKRSRGESTLFVNGEAIPEGVQTEGMQVVPDRASADRATIVTGEGGKRVRLKVGESLDRGTGTVRDVVDGEVRVARPRASAGR
ncbi:MAG TPA: hypothetical protein VKP89_14520 [Burkholderiales bacterium]|nr:hypothetical protein [Burkholderiales bacterium]